MSDAVDPGNPEPEADPAPPAAPESESPPIEPDPVVPPLVSDLPVEPITPADAATREKVEAANADASYGQTVVTNTAGDATVVGAVKPEPTYVDGVAQVNHDLEIDGSGQSKGVKTPLGVVIISYEEDNLGVGRVAIATVTDNADFQLVAETDVLRHRPS